MATSQVKHVPDISIPWYKIVRHGFVDGEYPFEFVHVVFIPIIDFSAYKQVAIIVTRTRLHS